MPLGNQQRSTYLNLSGGKFKQRVSPGTDGAVPRTNKNGDEVFELAFDSLSNVLITGVNDESTDFGDMLKIRVSEVDGSADYTISVAVKSGYSKAFLNFLPNIDLQKPVSLHAYAMPIQGQKDKTKAGLYVKQDGNKVAGKFWWWNAETEKPEYADGFPQYKAKKFSQTTWDAHVANIVAYLLEDMHEAKYKFAPKPSEAVEGTQNEEKAPTDSGDLPY